MKYMGSKRRIAKDLLNIMLQDIGDRYFVDCFTGGGNLIQFATCKNKIASDINPYSIAFLKRIQKEGCDWLPKNNKEFTEEDYKYMKAHKEEFDNAILGFVGYTLSFGSMWFHCWARNKKGRDYVTEAYNSACQQAEKIKDIKFVCCSYDELDIPENSVIYCDIPYRNSYKYEAIKEKFDYEKFYKWCKDMTNKGHKVFISEYNMPSDFKCVWEKEHKVQINKDSNNIKSVERLYTL